MRAVPDRVYLHIGLHKTGTTYVQSALKVNTAELAARGVDYPQGREIAVFRAVDDVQGRRPRGTDDARIAGAWDALVQAVEQSELPTVVISDERLSLSGLRVVSRVCRSFVAREVHVVLSVRDLARTLVSSWEEAVRGAGAWTWPEFVDAVRDPACAGSNPARGFWARQDVGRIAAAWESVVPADRLHIVTVPPAGTDREVLVDRFASCIGIDRSALPQPARRSNESIGVAGTEVVRRLNLRLGQRLNQREYAHVVRDVIAPKLAQQGRRAVAAGDALDWARARADHDIALLRERGYPVVGDLQDLLPAAGDGPCPDEVEDGELLEAALDALVHTTESCGKTWWAARGGGGRRTGSPPRVSRTGSPPRVSSAARGLAFRSRRVLLECGERFGVLRRGLRVAVRMRQARQQRAAETARASRA